VMMTRAVLFRIVPRARIVRGACGTIAQSVEHYNFFEVAPPTEVSVPRTLTGR
jgi:hypothetical protein